MQIAWQLRTKLNANRMATRDFGRRKPLTRRNSRPRIARQSSTKLATSSGSTPTGRSTFRRSRSITARPRPAASPAARSLRRQIIGRRRGIDRHSTELWRMIAESRRAQVVFVFVAACAKRCPRRPERSDPASWRFLICRPFNRWFATTLDVFPASAAIKAIKKITTK